MRSTVDWQEALLGSPLPRQGESLILNGIEYRMAEGILRQHDLLSDEQSQTRDAFCYKWRRRDTYDSEAVRNKTGEWLKSRYGELSGIFKPGITALDAGCGSGFTSSILLRDFILDINFIGVEISGAVDVAAQRFAEMGIDGWFLQANLMCLPFPKESLDVIISEGVLHHTDSTESAIAALVPLLKRGGYFLFYVYLKKGPIREFCDDYIRYRLQGMPEGAAWELLKPLTKLGIALGELNISIDVSEPIELLGIPAGKIDLQRFIYWNVFKAYYDPKMTLEEMNHINFDWYAPKNAHRQSPEEVRAWCGANGLEIECEVVEEAGMTIVARRA